MDIAMHTVYRDIHLLRDGSEAFPEILSCIKQARKSIVINMFIWRGDQIGSAIAEAVLEAADRGVKIDIIKDRYGICCEYGEEDQTSMFHPVPTAYETAQIRTLEFLYNRDLFGKEITGIPNPLALRMRSHPNITVHSDTIRKDHSKFYLFDDEILIFGGINIEDKENGSDRLGRTYRDYMVKLCGTEAVSAFKAHRSGCKDKRTSIFAQNIKAPVRQFEVKDAYLDLIRNAEKELTILMAYFSPVPEFMHEIEQASLRGVNVRILIPGHANFNDSSNHYTVNQLYNFGQKHRTSISVYRSPDMTHTKLVRSEKTICLGSCNITKNAFDTLDELNLIVPVDNSEFTEQVIESSEQIIQNASKVTCSEELEYDRFLFRLERTVL